MFQSRPPTASLPEAERERKGGRGRGCRRPVNEEVSLTPLKKMIPNARKCALIAALVQMIY